MEAARQAEGQRCRASRQKCSCFYLQRRHDIPCPLKPATERCSPCSCCRRTSLAITSTAKRRAARNPIGLTGTVPNFEQVETLSEKSAREGEPERETCRRVQDGGKEWRCSERYTELKATTAKWVVMMRLDEEDSYTFSVSELSTFSIN